jgi:hypothetical protein
LWAFFFSLLCVTSFCVFANLNTFVNFTFLTIRFCRISLRSVGFHSVNLVRCSCLPAKYNLGPFKKFFSQAGLAKGLFWVKYHYSHGHFLELSKCWAYLLPCWAWDSKGPLCTMLELLPYVIHTQCPASKFLSIQSPHLQSLAPLESEFSLWLRNSHQAESQDNHRADLLFLFLLTSTVLGFLYHI